MADSTPQVVAPRRLSRTFTARVTGVPNPPSGPVGVLVESVWWGLAAGLAEVGVLLLRRTIEGTTVLGALQMRRHFLWMLPTAQLAIFAAVGLPLALLAGWRPKASAWLARVVFPFLTALGLLLLVPGLHDAAAVVLAAGVASRLGRRIGRHPAGYRRLVRRGLPALVVGALALGGWSFDRLVLSESRALAALPAAKPGAPNVLLIVLDTVSAGHLSLYGYDRPTTPNLRKLARRGVVFEGARASAPWTLPSHATLFTGRWPSELGVREDRPLDARFPTLAEFLGRRGYATSGFVGNLYYCNSWFGLARGFLHYEDYFEQNAAVSPGEALRCAALGRELIRLAGLAYKVRSDSVAVPKDAARVNRDFLRWLDAQDSRRPFFTFLNYIDAHDPYRTPPGFDRHVGRVPANDREFGLIADWHRLVQVQARGGDLGLSPAELTLVRDAYDDCLAALDEQLGRLFDELDRRGVLDRTLVVIAGDHGEEFGEHGYYGHGLSLHREQLHVPLLLLGPGVPAVGRVAEPVSLRDIPATVADRLGLAAASPFPGHSLARAWDARVAARGGEGAPIASMTDLLLTPVRRPASGWAPALCGPIGSVVLGGRTYLRGPYGEESLYDTAADPVERNDLASDPAERAALERCRRALDAIVPGLTRARGGRLWIPDSRIPDSRRGEG